ncbi:MAG: type II secretion system protein GspM [Gammaproteobacteria bacterium]|nr:type II secretion system protein GspM [Gammaproteobacteria bacterium]
MIKTIEKQQQRRLAIVMLIIFVGVFFSITALPIWLANTSHQANIDRLHDRLLRFRQVATSDASLRPQYEELKRSQMSVGHYLKSDTVAVAGAELQRMVKDIATANRAQVISTQILSAGQEQGFIRIAIKVRLRGTVQGVLQSIYDIETSEVFLFLDNVSMRDSTPARRPRQLAIKQMDTDFDLIAYMPDIL